jgi:hypothetical protein
VNIGDSVNPILKSLAKHIFSLSLGISEGEDLKAIRKELLDHPDKRRMRFPDKPEHR